MYAVIETGGKQYRVQLGDVVQIEKKEGDKGSQLKFDQVLLMSRSEGEEPTLEVGKPYLEGASIQGQIVGQGRGEKILIIKMKRRKQYRRTQGHRQDYTQVLVTGFNYSSEWSKELGKEELEQKLASFQSHLKAKGLPQSPKLRISRKRLAAQKEAEFRAVSNSPSQALGAETK